ncbi:protein containing fibronectin type III domains [Reinekea sp. MED297]|uniref:Protein containing fibronectin type III domains n=2 Tax=Reinekea TaxID=230494 RepID=A4BBT6_9GAMM|nr:protein containing fibronectin type III domains [Reinekea sp. MED297] [Reinekea blandensis MED297]
MALGVLLSGCELSNEFAPLDTKDSQQQPSMPQALTGDWYSDSLELSWQDASEEENFFELRWRSDLESWSVPVFTAANTEHLSVTSIPAGNHLTVQLRAGNSHGESSWLSWDTPIPESFGSNDGDNGSDPNDGSVNVPDRPQFSTVPGEPVYHAITVSGEQGAQLYMGRNDGVGIDLVVVSEGYTEAQLEQFVQDAQLRVDQAFDYHPLRTHLPAWNIHILSLASAESGADHATAQGELVDTRFGANFWCGGTERLLCVDANSVFREVANYVPQYDEILVLVNSEKYGGAGYGSGIATASLASAVVNLIRHEIGHSFAHLADEYTYGGSSPPSSEPAAANVTLNNDPFTIKWNHWIEDPSQVVLNQGDQVGVWEGGSYVSTGVYRPLETSIMRQLGQPFGPVNAEGWASAVYDAVDPVLTYHPQETNLSMSLGQSMWFALNPLYDETNLSVTWFVDGEPQTVAADDPLYFLFTASAAGTAEVSAIITDQSGVIRKDLTTRARQELNWQLMVSEE